MKKIVRVGSRDSKLAVAQTMTVVKELKKQHPDITFELVTMKTTGDKILDRNLDQIGGKGLFVKELDKALLDKRIDLSIHSLKDLPMEISEDIPVVGFSKREDPRDVLLIKKGMEETFGDGCIGTSSRRRMEQLKKIYPNATFRGIRGNVQTRLAKLEKEDYSATILAKAGLARLGMEDYIDRVFDIEEMIPAAGQGILAYQGRKGEDYSYLQCVCDQTSEYAARAERSFVKYLDGGCSSPVAAYAQINGEELTLHGLYYHEPASDYVVGKTTGNVAVAEALGEALAKELKARWN
ncbi:MAG: hydroxymethylbilane synthase [Clostridium sp.]|nr:hydroxymethylbilane synthase [Clostridium sp.]